MKSASFQEILHICNYEGTTVSTTHARTKIPAAEGRRTQENLSVGFQVAALLAISLAGDLSNEHPWFCKQRRPSSTPQYCVTHLPTQFSLSAFSVRLPNDQPWQMPQNFPPFFYATALVLVR